MTSELRRAIQRYQQFREAHPKRGPTVSAARPRALWRLGVLEFVGYMTTHGGKPALYTHHFAPGSRPALYAGVRRNQLALFGGRFEVTARGITDRDARGAVVDYTPRFVVVPAAEWKRMQNLTRRRRRP